MVEAEGVRGSGVEPSSPRVVREFVLLAASQDGYGRGQPFLLELEMQEKCKPICKKNARNLQQFLYLSCNILGNRNFHFFCILHYETQK